MGEGPPQAASLGQLLEVTRGGGAGGQVGGRRGGEGRSEVHSQGLPSRLPKARVGGTPGPHLALLLMPEGEVCGPVATVSLIQSGGRPAGPGRVRGGPPPDGQAAGFARACALGLCPHFPSRSLWFE